VILGLLSRSERSCQSCKCYIGERVESVFSYCPASTQLYERVVVAAAEKQCVNCQLQSFPGGALNAQLARSDSTTATHGKSLNLAAVKPDSLRM
jgi:hypothetical protein